jgi:hypothetical protein
MNLKLPISIVSSLVLLISLAVPVAAQQKRQTPAKTQAPPAPAPAPTPPPPTLETLLPAETYRIYGEVRSVGQLIRSNSVNEILEPILKLAGPPKEFRTVIKWLQTNADEVMSSRLILAGWTAAKDLPDTLVAIEFASPEEAGKFQLKLNPFLQKMIPPATPAPAGEPNKSETPQPPPFHIQQAGSLILITPTPLNLKKLRPAGSKLLSDDVNFRVARNRLNTESVFVFVDVNAIEKEEAEQRKKAQEQHEKAIAERAANPKAEEPKIELATEPNEPEPTFVPEKHTEVVGAVELGTPTGDQVNVKEMTPPPVYLALDMVLGTISGAQAKWPAAVGVALSLEGDSFDLRALLINAPGEKSDPIPFFPVLAPGPAITPEAPNILPADTEMLVTMSLDLLRMYSVFSNPPNYIPTRHDLAPVEQSGEAASPLADLEKQLKIKIKDDLLPLLGSEIAVSLPMTGMDWFQPPKPPPPPTTSPASPLPSPQPSPDSSESASDTFTITETARDPLKDTGSVVISIALKDKEGMRALLPKLIESMAFKGASAFAQTERRDDTELVSYANVVAYAFIGNFLVISPDIKATRHVVDSYLKHQTLSGDVHFKNYTRWQPRQLQGQVYVSPSLMESYRTWIQQPTAQIDEQTRAFLTRFSIVAQPVTYSLSNEGFGPLHELHLPKNLVLLIIAATAGIKSEPQTDMPSNTAPMVQPPRPDNPY